MSLTESIVENVALTGFLLRRGFGGQVGELLLRLWEAGHGSQLAPGEYAGGTLIPAPGENEEDGEVVLAGRLRKAIRRLNPTIRFRAFATLRDPAPAGLAKLLSGELSLSAVALAQAARRRWKPN